jgi:NADH-quinone oxidoreductase E subunit
MSATIKAITAKEPKSFEFTKENFNEAQKIIAKYPAGRQQSAVMPLLMMAQKQNDNWLPKIAMDYVASILGMAPIRVYEVATFYTMYNLKPVGKYMIEVCVTTPCWLKGSDDIVKACEKRLGITMNETTSNGLFTLKEAECLGACVNAPMCQVGDHYYEDLTPDNIKEIIDQLAKGEQPKPGPQSARKTSEPLSGLTTLTEVKTGVQKATKAAPKLKAKPKVRAASKKAKVKKKDA